VVEDEPARRRTRTRLLWAMLLVAVLVPACTGSPEPAPPAPPMPAGPAPSPEQSPELQLPPFTPPSFPLPDPRPDGFGVTLTKFLTLPRTETIPPVTDDRLERYNRINYLGEIPDGSGRLYVPDMNGMLFVISDGKPAPYLDVGGQVGPSFFTQKGLGSGLSFAAFHPDFARNGKVYTAHTEARVALTGAKPNLGPTPARTVVHSVLTEWTFRDPAAATFDGTRRELMRIGFVGTYHNVQQIGFNPTAKTGDEDYGLLYLAVGDGGAVNTAADDGAASTVPQDLTVPQGKVLRIDPLGTSPGKQYGIPRGNPFVDKPGALGEIYAYGLRDPHRFSWDPEGAHPMLLGSIGEDNVESIYDVRPGDNFGWSEREGPFVVQPARNCLVTKLPADDRRGFVYPVAAYGHTIPPGIAPCSDTGHAVIGGFVYRGEALPELRGKYVFGDGVSGQVFYTEAAEMRRGKELAKVRELTLFDEAGAAMNLRTVAGDPKVLTAGKPRVDMKFGIDGKGELYVLAKANGTIWKVTGTKQVEPPVPSATPAPQPSPSR
jgi:glucose/arabinose dehydrogenase